MSNTAPVTRAVTTTSARARHLRLAPPPAPQSSARRLYVVVIKPAIDRIVAGVLCVLLAPLFAFVAIAVRFALGSPVLLRQRRVGRDGRPFDVLKFRTMRHDRRERQVPHGHGERRVSHKRVDDPRHTRLGRFLRRWSLDELPQLWNVVAGDMSLVGPRPELVEVVERYEPWQHGRHAVRPGLTGLWQVSHRGDGLMHEHTDVDLEYVDHIGMGTDLRILARTLPALVEKRGT